ncbi:uncharacterized protein BDR25DRAFT_269107 [Lindgomyces ingoldianus]|uniref:Uncharacterized protein n=1 Tax=Lindgomyces ingoldianus TaxID=673940 RepID=A0ACB6QIS2_9PLEO|nr:uncharacterized protein BDR25DRAFT_269107 [Lindgomyces ingoldianus]KAF2466040.1 hypothetical protein BDR25DRAFT_269107 [Lindgomyces ingoldianus]
MATSERPLSFLPTIKCSSCGVDIDISQLADHVCAVSSAQAVEPTAPKLDRAATFGASRFSSNSPNQARPGRVPPPPRIDPSAANKPFRPQNQLTPLSSYSDPKSYSPLSPINARQPFQMNRSATSPMPLPLSPPSPDLPSNMDCAFPPFPSQTPRSAKPRSKDRLEPTYSHRYAEADPMYAPLSPRMNGGESVVKRMDTIAPGPFDGRGGDSRPSTSNGRRTPVQHEPTRGHRRTATQSSTYSNSKGPNQRTSVASNRSRSSTYSNGSVGLPSRPKLGPGGVPPPPRLPQTEGIDAFLNRLQKETMEPLQIGQDSRSRTFPLRKESGEDAGLPPRPRRPSESNGSVRRPTDIESFKSGPRPANMFPAKSSSRAGSKSGITLDNVPPLPVIPDYEKNLPPKPLHTPSDSGQSDDSVSSSGFGSVASSRSSPPASVASAHSRKPSKVGGMNYLGEVRIPRTASPDELFMDIPPPRLDNRDQPSGYNKGNAPAPLLQPPPMPFSDAPESPLDPAIQRGLLYERRPSDPQSSNQAPSLGISRSPPKQVSTSELRDPAIRRPPAGKGRCRGCSEPIVGKSVKDSSGRLTGRYHKQCFVCRTCRDPFPTADFYVFENSPYCEQHYHQLNGSLCKSCDRGIEGQYLETDQRQKFHPKCFTCLVCRIVLRDDYYEVGGKVYCDRHAYHASQQSNFLGPGGNKSRNLQKRTTRLMMMM